MKAWIETAKIMAFVIGGSMLWASVFTVPLWIKQNHPEWMETHNGQ